MNRFLFYILQTNMIIERIRIYLGEKSMKMVKKCASKALKMYELIKMHLGNTRYKASRNLSHLV